MDTTKFRLIIFLLFFISFMFVPVSVVKPSSALEKVKTVKFAPKIDRPGDKHLLNMDLEGRRNLCKENKALALEVGPLFTPKGVQYHVPKAHHYNFDGTESLAVPCPFLPRTYISDDGEMDDGKHRYIVRREKDIEVDPYEFDFEVAKEVDSVIDQWNTYTTLADYLKPKNHRLYTMGKEERWRICLDALRFVRYNFDLNSIQATRARFRVFKYGHVAEIYLSFACYNKPNYMYIRAGHSENGDVLTITVIAPND